MARRASADHQETDDIFPADEWCNQSCAVTGTQSDLIELRGHLLPQIGDLGRLGLCKDQRDVRLVKADVLTSQCVDQLLIHAVGSAQMKFASQIVKDVDCASIRTGELHCLADDGRQNGFKIKC